MSESAVKPLAAPLSYALPATSHGARVWAGIFVTLAGLILIAFGGCFLIGVLIHLDPSVASPFAPASQLDWKTRDEVLQVVLYLAALICFVAGAAVTFRGLNSLLRIAGGYGAQ